MISSRMLRAGLLTLGLAAVAAPVFASISTDYDHHADFRSYKTFSFYKVQMSNPLDTQRIKNEVTRDLTQAGMEQVPSGGDVTITAIEDVKNEKEYNTFYDGLGDGGFGWGGWGGWGSPFWGGGWGKFYTYYIHIYIHFITYTC